MKILVCDDDQFIRKIVTEMLGFAKHQVTTAFDGQDALEKIQTNTFDVLITDYKMPRLSGAELAGRLRMLNIPLKVIMISGFSSALDARERDQLQLDGFLKKPFKPSQLFECLSNVC